MVGLLFIQALAFCLMNASSYALEPNEFQKVYQQVTNDLREIESKTPSHIFKKFKSNRRLHGRGLKKEHAVLKKKYKQMHAQKLELDQIHDLKTRLVSAYQKSSKTSFDPQKLDEEATRLSIALLDEIPRLKKKYKSFFMPIVGNLLIDVGIKKRGACKHWAEDLLNFLKPMKRDFFHVTWGEANAKKFNEHNVAVIYPMPGTFADGVVIDPWRTGGAPFWVEVKNDGHYKWKYWSYYGVY